jgi:ribosomal protein L11 methylase PrmA
MLELLLEKSRSKLILSGILAEQEQQIISELKDLGSDSPIIGRDGEWIAVTVQR